MYSAVILSGGKGSRMAMQLPKQYLLMAGKPMIMHTIERLEHIDEIDEIIIVCEDEFVSSIDLMLKQYGITKKTVYAAAGETRQKSAYNGIKKVSNEHVIIHEAARPFVLKKDFQRLIDEPEHNVTFGYPIPFTVVEGNNFVENVLDRSKLVNIQLPQKFETAVLKKAHEEAENRNMSFTEDAGMVFDICNKEVKILRGSSYNIKITEPIDLYTGEIIYKEYVRGTAE